MRDRFIVFDLEMPHQRKPRISAIGITIVEKGEIIDSIYYLVNPETSFDPYVVELVGITEEMVKDEPTFPEIWEKIRNIMDSGLLVAHGAPGDMKTLCGCLKSYNLKWKDELEYLCTCDMALDYYKHLGHYRLCDLCEHIGFNLDNHNAKSDSEGCAAVLLHFLENGSDVENYIRRNTFQNMTKPGARKLKKNRKSDFQKKDSKKELKSQSKICSKNKNRKKHKGKKESIN